MVQPWNCWFSRTIDRYQDYSVVLRKLAALFEFIAIERTNVEEQQNFDSCLINNIVLIKMQV